MEKNSIVPHYPQLWFQPQSHANFHLNGVVFPPFLRTAIPITTIHPNINIQQNVLSKNNLLSNIQHHQRPSLAVHILLYRRLPLPIPPNNLLYPRTLDKMDPNYCYSWDPSCESRQVKPPPPIPKSLQYPNLTPKNNKHESLTEKRPHPLPHLHNIHPNLRPQRPSLGHQLRLPRDHQPLPSIQVHAACMVIRRCNPVFLFRSLECRCSCAELVEVVEVCTVPIAIYSSFIRIDKSLN